MERALIWVAGVSHRRVADPAHPLLYGVIGPKTDVWLVKTIGGLILVIGAAIALPPGGRTSPPRCSCWPSAARRPWRLWTSTTTAVGVIAGV